MCNLKALNYACGHTHLTVSERCGATRRVKSTLTTSPPDFCLAGNDTRITGITIPKTCSTECHRQKALDAITKRFKDAKEKVDKVSERADAIQRCVSRGESPKLEFVKGLKQKGWDEEKLEALSKEALEEVKKLTTEYGWVKKEALKELEKASATGKASLRTFEIDSGTGKLKEMVAIEALPLENLGDELRAQLYDLVLEMERRASDACLEGLGWKGPEEDKEQREVLRERAVWKKGIQSGTRMDDAYIRVRTMNFTETNGLLW